MTGYVRFMILFRFFSVLDSLASMMGCMSLCAKSSLVVPLVAGSFVIKFLFGEEVLLPNSLALIMLRFGEPDLSFFFKYY